MPIYISVQILKLFVDMGLCHMSIIIQVYFNVIWGMNYEPVYILCFCMFNAINIQVYSTVLSRIIESMLNEKDVEEQQSWRTTLISV
jgi:hypothetical protein